MKNFILAILVGFAMTAQAQWALDTSFLGTPTEHLALVGTDVFTLTSNNKILVLHDGAEVWEEVSPPNFASGVSKQSMIYSYQDNIYALDDSLIMYRSSNLGQTWTSWTPTLNNGDPIPFAGWHTLFFPFGDTLVMVDYANSTSVVDDFYVFYSTDQGVTFTSAPKIFNNCKPCNGDWDTYREIFVGDKYATIRRRDSLYYTSDLQNWSLIELPLDKKVFPIGSDFYFSMKTLDSNLVLIKTTNLGISWDTTIVETNQPLYSYTSMTMDLMNNRIIFTKQSISLIYYSINDGSIIYDTVSNLEIYQNIDYINSYYYLFTGIWKDQDTYFICNPKGILQHSFVADSTHSVNKGLGYHKFTPYTSVNSPYCIAQLDSVYISYDYGVHWQIWQDYYTSFQNVGYYNLNDVYINESDIFFIEYMYLYKCDMLTSQISYVDGQPPFPGMDNFCVSSEISEEYYSYLDNYDILRVRNIKTLAQYSDGSFTPYSYYFYPIDGYFGINNIDFDPMIFPFVFHFDNSTIEYQFDQIGNMTPGSFYMRKLGDLPLLTNNTSYYYTLDTFATWHPYIPTANTNASFNSFSQLGPLNYQDSLVHAIIGNHFYRSNNSGLAFTDLNIDPLPIMQRKSRSLFINDYKAFLTTDLGTYSTVFTEIDIPTIQGLVYLDANSDSLQNNGEVGLPDTKISNATNQTMSNTNTNGYFYMAYGNVSDSIFPSSPNPYLAFTPDFALVNAGSDTISFTAHYIPNQHDVSINATLNTTPVVGFNNTIYLNITNLGTTLQSPSVYVILPIGINFLSANPAYTSQNIDTLFWNIGTLDILQQYPIVLSVNIDASLSIGTTLSAQTTVMGTSQELTWANNSASVLFNLMGAFDPNDKRVEPKSLNPDLASVGQFLDYTIRFQNTGNYPATFVRISDTLSQQLDINTIELVDASHAPMSWQILPNRVLQFSFDAINLPDSTNNEPESHGFVRFKIKTIPGLQLSDVVENNADIFFDFNAPVRTNTAEASIASGVQVLPFISEAAILPNPNSGHCTFQLPDHFTGSAEVQIINMGQQVVWNQQIEVHAGISQLLDYKLPSGAYILRVQTGNKTYGAEFINY
jgi:uncharacterized repeat protein (TIGR01451 family)